MTVDLLFIIALFTTLIFIAALGLWLTARPKRKRSNWARLRDALYYWIECGFDLRESFALAWSRP
jgi:hypothetical protein